MVSAFPHSATGSTTTDITTVPNSFPLLFMIGNSLWAGAQVFGYNSVWVEFLSIAVQIGLVWYRLATVSAVVYQWQQRQKEPQWS